MQFAACDGVVMNNRSGTIPPGIILMLLHNGFAPHLMSSLLSERSGIYALAPEADRLLTTTQELLSFGLMSGAREYYLRALLDEMWKAIRSVTKVDAFVFSGGVALGAPIIVREVVERLKAGGLNMEISKDHHLSQNGSLTRISRDGVMPVYSAVVDEAAELLHVALTSLRKPSNDVKASGICICPGIARGHFTYVENADGPRNRMIGAAVELTPKLVLSARGMGGLVTTVGSPTCHGATLCRELNIPTISGIPLEIVRAQIGKMVFLDASAGEISCVQ
jgi:phosphohistidine swiveling domain-containing protein